MDVSHVPFASTSGTTAPVEEETECPQNLPARVKIAAKALIDGVPERMLPKPSQIFRTIDVDENSGESSNANKGVPERIARRVKFKRCAVVGNGGILKSAEFGAAIDAHDVVFDKPSADGDVRTLRRREDDVASAQQEVDATIFERRQGVFAFGEGVYLIASRGIDKIARNLVKAYPNRPDVRMVGLESGVRGASWETHERV